MTYKIYGNPLTRGFSVFFNGSVQFRTRHLLGWFPKSKTVIKGQEIEISPLNFVGDKLKIVKSGQVCGEIDFSKALYSMIIIKRVDGGEDRLRVDALGYQQEYVLHKDPKFPLLKISYSLNPIKLDNKYFVEVLDPSLPDVAIEELLLYVGEIMFRNPMI